MGVIPDEVTEAINSCDFVIGSDECGYGAYAGPLVVCAAVIPKDWAFSKLVRDSKAVKTEEQRQEIAKQIVSHITYDIVSVPVNRIDEVGVYKILISSHQEAISRVRKRHGDKGRYCAIADGRLPLPGIISLPKADALIPAVSAASILGKVARDVHMTKMSDKYPGYGFARHKGYGTPEHEAALRSKGPCEIHRKSYAPVAKLLKGDQQNICEELPTDEDTV